MTTPVLLSFSGGKDSVLALARLRASPEVEVVGLIATVVADDRTLAMHGLPERLVEAQAASLGLPLLKAIVPCSPSNDTYESALEAVLADSSVRHVAFGDLFLEDIRHYRDALLARLGRAAVYPLWGEETGRLAQRFLADGYRALAVCIDTAALDASFAGREMDTAFFRALPPGVDPCGENGEFHSFVFDGPGFAFAVPFDVASERDDGRFRRACLAPGPMVACARCGAPFSCGTTASVDRCWCADLPPVEVLDPAAGCCCPRCLRAVSASSSRGSRQVQ